MPVAFGQSYTTGPRETKLKVFPANGKYTCATMAVGVFKLYLIYLKVYNYFHYQAMTRRKKGEHIPEELTILTQMSREYGHAESIPDHGTTDPYKQPFSEEEWRELTKELKENFTPADRERMQKLAQAIREGLLWCDETMDRYCNATCHSCQDYCCNANGIYFDLADLLYLLVLENDLPAGQTRARHNDPCRYLSTEGCILPRMCRPFICTWYICEPQMELLQAETIPIQKQFTAVLQMVRRCRQQLLALHEKGLRR